MALSIQRCCSVRSLSVAKQADGTISVTVTALRDDAEVIAKDIIREFSSEFQITSWRDEPPLRTVTAISKNSDMNHKIPKSGIFKSIPTEIYNLYQSGLYHRSIIPVTYEPDAERFIKPSDDIYGAKGWTCQEIFDELGLKVLIPSGLNYHVYQLSVQKNTPVLSLLRTLFPIPGILIYHYHGKFYVTMPSRDPIPDARDQCRLVGESENEVDYKHEVIGQQGEPLYIDTDNIERVSSGSLNGQSELTANIDVTYNLVGGIFCINERKTTAASHTDRIIKEYFNESNRSMADDFADNKGHEET